MYMYSKSEKPLITEKNNFSGRSYLSRQVWGRAANPLHILQNLQAVCSKMCGIVRGFVC